MTKFLVLWKRNMLAPWPTDRREIAENMEAMFAAIERYIEAGIVRQHGFFTDGDSGSFIFEGTSAEVLKLTSFYSPLIEYDVREIIPYEMGKNIVLESLRMQELVY
jgi:hypothetical protein